MESSTQQVRLLVMIDTLFDMRLAVLHSLDPTYPDLLLESKKYHGRLSDEFHLELPGLKPGVYEAAYKARDVEILAKSFMTNIIIELDKIVTDLERSYVTGDPDATIPIVEINTYPYKLTTYELESLQLAVKEQVGFICEVEMVNYSYRQMNIDMLRAGSYGAIVIYNFDEWLYDALQGLAKHPVGIPHVLVISPALFPSRERTKELDSLRAPNGRTIDPFDAMTTQLAELIGVRFIDVAHYSIIYPEAV